MTDYAKLRSQMVDSQIAARGVRSGLVLDAMREVPREKFLPASLREFAYDDTPLPIDANQTISQPYIVGFMIDALGLEGGEKVLEIGAGSGYAAAVLSRIAAEVYTVERIGQLAERAQEVLQDLGYGNVNVLHGDGTLGWEAHAPFDAIIVAAGGPKVPEALKQQLRVGGRMMIPVGSSHRVQELVRVTRTEVDEFVSEDIADVRFVPLLGEEGWQPDAEMPPKLRRDKPRDPDAAVVETIARHAQPFDDVDRADLAPLLKRIGAARVVLIGESTHGTSEFYRMRERLTRALITEKGFNIVAIEGDWPDATRIDHYVRHMEYPATDWEAFARFPVWMWRNSEVRAFVDWLREHNGGLRKSRRVAFHGLDIYSLYNSIRAVLRYLDDVDPETAKVARVRYGCLTPWQSDPATYGRAALSGRYPICERDVVDMLGDLLKKHAEYKGRDGERFLDAVQNARLITSAERYYRIMYYGSRASWNLRDGHMFETLQSLLSHYGSGSKVAVWAHNSHVGDASATEMSARGELNIGQLCRREFGDKAFLIGFGTDEGTVAAASDWDGPMEIKTVRASLPESYEALCRATGMGQFFLPIRGAPDELRQVLLKPRLQRAIGVVYRPDSELASHYFEAILPRQFDEYIWIGRTRAVSPLKAAELEGTPETYPFGV
ncbi:MAG: protein-L-isoaspartate(D-aspartate) O-methyltransferase [Hyphomicrobiales bacterium]